MSTPQGPSSVASSNVGDGDLSKRLEAIVEVEKKIAMLVETARGCIADLAKEKQTTKNRMEESAAAFKKILNGIETDLSAQMQYLSNVCVGSAHQGSTFASQQNIEIARSAEAALHHELIRISEKHFPPPSPLPDRDDNNREEDEANTSMEME